jgi:hypothetical protein
VPIRRAPSPALGSNALKEITNDPRAVVQLTYVGSTRKAKSRQEYIILGRRSSMLGDQHLDPRHEWEDDPARSNRMLRRSPCAIVRSDPLRDRLARLKTSLVACRRSMSSARDSGISRRLPTTMHLHATLPNPATMSLSGGQLVSLPGNLSSDTALRYSSRYSCMIVRIIRPILA